MKIQLSDHFTYQKLLRFAFPSILMMIFTSVYGMVDGYFVSNFVGKDAFAAVNFIMPFLMILGAAGTMLGGGGGALVAITLGQGDGERANRLFSLFFWAIALSGVVLGVAGFVLLRPVAAWLGAEGAMLDDCVLYGRWVLPAMPAFVLQYGFESFFVTGEKPKLGLMVNVGAGVCNMLLDALLVGVFPFGLRGAAVATALSQTGSALLSTVYFARKNSSLLQLVRPRWDGSALARACLNGSSELVTGLSMSLLGMLYNVQLLRYAGEDGVAAYGVLMYVTMIFLAAFMGYSTGTAPVVGFHYGANHPEELRSLLQKSLVILSLFSLTMFLAGEFCAGPLATLFVGYDPGLRSLTLRGFFIYSFSYLFVGIPIYGSAFFTALGDGVISAAISFLRTVVFELLFVLTLPLLWGVDGIWVSTVVTEVVAAGLTIFFWVRLAKKYGYGR